MTSLGLWHFLIVCTFSVLFVVPVWRIVSKAGYSGALSLLGLIPLVNIVLLWVFAFSEWPTQRSRTNP